MPIRLAAWSVSPAVGTGCAPLSLPLKPIRATYRLQLEPAFGFDQAAGIVPYLAALGVSHVYCSPVFEAVPGSRHGYDIVDPTRVRGELGGAEARARFVATLREHGLGLIADIVPNHVALEGNAWWIDVLTHGTASASFPDLRRRSERRPVRRAGLGQAADPDPRRALWPRARRRPAAAGDRAGQAARRLRRQPLPALDHVARRARRRARRTGPRRTRRSGLAAIVAALNADRARLHALLEAQHYRLTWWRLARDESPYRRFFDVNGLIGVRVEDPEVFDAMHRLVAEWVADGSVDGPARRSRRRARRSRRLPAAAARAGADAVDRDREDPRARARRCRRGRSTARPATRPARCSRGC